MEVLISINKLDEFIVTLMEKVLQECKKDLLVKGKKLKKKK